MPEVPVDDPALDAIEHALGGCLTYTAEDGSELGEPRLVGAEYQLADLLDFWAGHDRDNAVLIGYAGTVPIHRALTPTFSEHDLIRALIAEIRRLRVQIG